MGPSYSHSSQHDCLRSRYIGLFKGSPSFCVSVSRRNQFDNGEDETVQNTSTKEDNMYFELLNSLILSVIELELVVSTCRPEIGNNILQ